MVRQIALELEPPLRQRSREQLSIYLTVLRLRARGMRVYRRGRQHLVGDRQLTTREMLRFADAVRNCLTAATASPGTLSLTINRKEEAGIGSIGE